MRIAHLSDLHITERPCESGATLEEQRETLLKMSKDIGHEYVDVIVVAGDVFDAVSTPKARNVAVEVFRDMATYASVVIVKGNHDVAGDLSFLSFLGAEHSITAIEEPGPFTLRGALFYALPWPRKADLVHAMGATSSTTVSASASVAMKLLLTGIRQLFENTDKPRVLLGHLELGSALTDSGQPLAGKCDVELSAGDLLDTEADAILLGHIHKAQTIEEYIHYCGSPRPTTFGQEDSKGWTLADVERGATPIFEHRRASYRPLLTIEGHWERECMMHDDGQQWFDLDHPHNRMVVPEGSAVRIKYNVEEASRQQAAEAVERLKKELLAAGAHSVKLDPQIATTTRVRSEAVSAAANIEEKLLARWESVEGAVPTRKDQIIEKLRQIQSQQEVAG